MEWTTPSICVPRRSRLARQLPDKGIPRDVDDVISVLVLVHVTNVPEMSQPRLFS